MHRGSLRHFNFDSLSILVISICLFNLIVYPQKSKLYKGIEYISTFIASDYYAELQKTNDDLTLADTIYLRMLKYENYDYTETLFALTFGVIPYNHVRLRIPLLNQIVDYRLPSVPHDIFLRKNNNLPKRLFFDTPTDNYGDKDKPAHFFGSAYITFSENYFDLGNLIGYFVEAFEEDFEIQNSIDLRDLQSNVLGNIFGEILKNNKDILPSQIMILRTLFYLRFHL